MSDSFTKTLKQELVNLLTPLSHLATKEELLPFIVALDPRFQVVDDVVDLGLDDLVSAAEELVDSTDDNLQENIFGVIEKTAAVTGKSIALKDQLENFNISLDENEAVELLETLFRRLGDYLVYHYLKDSHPKGFAFFHLLGLVETEPAWNGDEVEIVQWERFAKLFSDPMEPINEVYGWEGAFNGDKFLDRFVAVLEMLGVPGGIYRQSETIRTKLGRFEYDDKEIRIPLFAESSGDDYAEIDLNISPLPATEEKRPGLFLYPYLAGGIEIDEEISDNWFFNLKGNASLGGGFGLELRPRAEASIVTDLFSDESLDSIESRLELQIAKRAPSGDLNYIFGDKDGSHLGFKELAFNILLALERGDYTVAGEIEVNGLELVIDVAEGDGFIQKILSGVKLESVSDLTVGVSNKDGLYFKGSSALEITIPVHKKLGPINLDSVIIGVGFGDTFKIILATSFGVKIGPISGAVERIGLEIPFHFPEDGKGNWGRVQMDGVRFLPPKGAGLAVDAGPVRGGGYLEFDSDKARYSGILELNLGDIGIVAIGLITTRMPDGTDGFSLLAYIGVTFSPPIELSFGFSLSGVGGLLGAHRTMMTDVLQKGLRNHTVDSILFPEDPIANALKIISDMRSVFPPEQNRFIVGPMVKFGWGSPNIITADVGIFIEFPEPIKVVLLGEIVVIVPEEENTIIEIHIDVLGMIDFSRKYLAIDASIYDSRILKLTLYGDIAVRLLWGNKPEFGMSLGGFHPSFTPPPCFPSLRRLTIGISSGRNFSLLCQSYQALTSNSLQFGTRFDLFAKAGPVAVMGCLGFDCLFYFDPFSFTASVFGSVGICFRSHTLAAIRLAFELSGPKPWNANGEGYFEILWWEISFSFDVTWGDSVNPPLPSIDPNILCEKLVKALTRSESWSTTLPPSVARAEILRSRDDDAEGGIIVVHPSGRLEVRETIFPLGVDLDLFGNAKVAGGARFDITGVTLDNTDLIIDPVEDYFARSQFESLTNDEKLSLPSFELMKGGVSSRIDSDRFGDFTFGMKLSYETVLLKPNFPAESKKTGSLLGRFSKRLVNGNSVGAIGRGTFELRGRAQKVSTAKETFAIVHNADMSIAEETVGFGMGEGMTRMEADQAMNRYLLEHPEQVNSVQVVSSFEVGA